MKLNDLFTNQKTNEAFGGMGSSLARKIRAAVNPTQVGAGQRKLEASTTGTMNAWANYRGATGVSNSGPEIHKWVSTTLGLDSDKIWDDTLNAFEQKYPKSAERYLNDAELDTGDLSNFFNTLIQTRQKNPEIPLWTAKQGTVSGADQASSTAPESNEWKLWDKNALRKGKKQNINAPQYNHSNDIGDGAQQAPQSREPFAGKLQHPVHAETGIHMHPEKETDIPDDTLEIGNLQAKSTSYTRTPSANVAAQSPAGNAGGVDWESIRSRFPKKTVTKPRIKVPMGSVGQEKPRFRVPARSTPV